MSDLTAVDNVWDVDGVASNKAKSLLYVARASAVLSAVLERSGNHQACSRGSISRMRLAIAIGCSRAVLNQNPRIVELIQQTEQLLKTKVPTSSASRLLQELGDMSLPGSPRIRLPRNSLYSRIVLARPEKANVGFIPTICFADGIHEASADWLRHFVGDCGEPSTALQYAKLLRAFLLYCRRSRVDWRAVNDHDLRQWRDHKEKKGRTRRHINVAIGVVFQFYCFCERRGIIRYRVGCYDRMELPERVRQMQFPIAAERVYRGASHQRVGWTTPLLYRNVGSSVGNRQTPSDDQMAGLHQLAIEGRTGGRDDLILSWFEDTAGRGMEVLQVTLNQIPGSEAIDELCGDSNPWLPIYVPRSKTGSGCTLIVSVDTLIATRSYIAGERAAVVARFTAEDPSYAEPPNLFLSSTTGAALTGGAVSAKFKPLFRTVGLQKANVHRVRAKAALDHVESLVDKLLDSGVQLEPGSAWVETILQQASLKLGHRSLLSLRHYLTVALQRRIRTAEVQRRNTAERADRRVDMLLRTALVRLGASNRFAAKLKSLTGPAETAAALREFAAEFEGSEAK